jgi:hypothetical protein
VVEAPSTGVLSTARHNSSEIYIKAQIELLCAQSALQVPVVAFSCGESGIKLVVSIQKDIEASYSKKKATHYYFTEADIVASFDLSGLEQSVFSRLIDAGYYPSLLGNTSIPESVGIFSYAAATPYRYNFTAGSQSLWSFCG